MKEKVMWGILGCANIAIGALIPAIKKSDSGELLSIASRSKERAKKVARDFGIPKVYGSYDELLLDNEVEAVYISLPNHLHKEWTIESAEKGKHILCEKPLGLNARECREMFEECRKNGVLLMEAFMYRFHAQTLLAKKIVDSGEIGQIKLMRSGFSFVFPIGSLSKDIRGKKDYGGGSLFDLGYYCVNVSRYIMGEEPVEVYATTNIHSSLGIDLSLESILSFSRGRRSLIDCSFERTGTQFYEIMGTEGSVKVPLAFLPGKNLPQVLVKKGEEVETHKLKPINEYRLEVEHFGECIRENKSPSLPFEESSGNARVLDTLFTSIKTGKSVKLEN